MISAKGGKMYEIFGNEMPLGKTYTVMAAHKLWTGTRGLGTYIHYIHYLVVNEGQKFS